MNTAVVIATRELRERWRVFVVAAAFAVLPFVISALPGARSSRADVIAMLGGIGAIAFAFGIALLLGGTTLVRDLVEKRMSFYFAKPVVPWMLWLGKAGAAILTVLATAAIIAVPSFLAVPSEWRALWGREEWAVPKLALLAAIAFFLVAHAIATMVRSRSILMALDLVLAACTVFAALLVVQPLLVAGAVPHVFYVWNALAGVVLVILAIAPVVQLARGRTDLRRSHAALSAVLWPAVAVSLLIAAAVAVWLTTPALESIDDVENMNQSRTGQWVFVTGIDKTRGDVPSSFLLNTKTGTSERFHPLRWTNVRFSRDGSTVVWLESDGLLPRFGRARLRARRLADGTDFPALIGTRMSDAIAISDDGSHVAFLGGRQVQVHELASGRMLAAARIVQDEVKAMYFSSPSTLRLIARPRLAKVASILELDITRKSLAKRAAFATAETIDFNELTASADGSALYVNREGKIIDARSGALRGTVPVTAPLGSLRGSLMLSDGRVVSVNGGVLSLFDRNGVHVRDVKLPVTRGIVVAEIEGGKVILSGRVGEIVAGVRGRKMLKVDLERGAVVTVKEDVYGPSHWWGIEPRLPIFSADVPLSAIDVNQRLVQWR